MTITSVSQWSTTPSDNTDLDGVSIAEGVAVISGMNNAIRNLMAQVAAAIESGEFVGSLPYVVATAANPTYFDFAEDTDNGANYVRVIAPATLGANYTHTLQAVTGILAPIPADPAADRAVFWDTSEGKLNYLTLPSNLVINGTELRAYETWAVALSDETTAITTGTNKATLTIPYNFTVVGVAASLNTASSSGTPTFDINEGGSTILSTKIVIDANEKSGGSSGYQGTAAAAAVISDAAIAAFAEIGVDIDVAGTGAKGAKVYIIGYRTT